MCVVLGNDIQKKDGSRLCMCLIKVIIHFCHLKKNRNLIFEKKKVVDVVHVIMHA